VVYGGDVFWAIEVKNAGTVRPADVSPLREFAGDYPECAPLLIYRGTDRLEIAGVRCEPVEEFLVRLHPDRVAVGTRDPFGG
jgi:hypothetical protein